VSSDGPTAQQAAHDLTAALNDLRDRLDRVRDDSISRAEDLTRYGKTNRRYIIGLVLSLVFDLVLTVVVGTLAVQAHHTSAEQAHTAASNLALCEAGNIARHQQIKLWDFALSLPTGQQRTAQQHNVAAFRVHLEKIFAPRDCAGLGRRH
jgi:hypothetical protein